MTKKENLVELYFLENIIKNNREIQKSRTEEYKTNLDFYSDDIVTKRIYNKLLCYYNENSEKL